MRKPASVGTAVTFFRRADGTLTGYRAEGHAGYADEGHDIVCAAISALTQSTLNGLVNVLKAPFMYDIDDDNALLEARSTPEVTDAQLKQAQLLLVTLLEGLRGIERSHPQNVRIFFEERR